MAKATLINKAGQKVVVESGSQQAQQYFGQGYTLMGAPTTPAASVATQTQTPTGSIPIPGNIFNTGDLQKQNFSNIQPVGTPGQPGAGLVGTPKAQQFSVNGVTYSVDPATSKVVPVTQALPPPVNTGTGNITIEELKGGATADTTVSSITNLLKSLETQQAQQKQYQQQLIAAQQETPEEVDLQTKLLDLRATADQARLATQQDIFVNIENRPDALLPAIRGEQGRRATAGALQQQTFASQEEALLGRLGLEQQKRQGVIEGIKTALGFESENTNTQFKILDALQKQEQIVFDRAQSLSTQTRQTLGTILDSFKGLDLEELDASTQGELASLASKAGIPIDLLVKGMKTVKDQVLYEKTQDEQENKQRIDQQKFDNSLELAKLGISQQTANRLSAGKTSGGSSGGGGGTAPSSSGTNAPGGPLSDEAQAVINGTLRLEDLTPTVRGKIAGELTRSGFQSGPKLSSAQQEDLATMNGVTELIKQLETFNADGKLEGIGGFGYGTLAGGVDAVFGTSSAEARSVRALIGNIKGTIAKLRGGTSFTPSEEALLNTYTPTINETTAVAINKLALLKKFIAQKEQDLYKYAQERGVTSQTNTSQQTAQDLRTKYNY